MAQQTPNAALIKQFVEETIQLAGFGDLPVEFRQQYQEKIELALLKKIGVTLNNLLTDQQVVALGQFLEKNPNPKPEEILEFYQNRLVELPEKLKNIMRDFQLDFLKNTATVTQGING